MEICWLVTLGWLNACQISDFFSFPSCNESSRGKGQVERRLVSNLSRKHIPATGVRSFGLVHSAGLICNFKFNCDFERQAHLFLI